MGQTLRIKELYAIERPREKLIKYGSSRLTDEELLAILLRTGRKGKNAIALARDILVTLRSSVTTNATGNLRDSVDITIADLIKVKGIGVAKACEIISCIELGKRFNSKSNQRAVFTADAIWNETKELHTEKREYFVILLLDTRRNLIKKELISIGTLNENLVHPREVFEPAIRHSAAHIILVHNHPSNIVEPSTADLNVTQQLIKSGELLGITVIDHVIVAKDGWYSFRESNLL